MSLELPLDRLINSLLTGAAGLLFPAELPDFFFVVPDAGGPGLFEAADEAPVRPRCGAGDVQPAQQRPFPRSRERSLPAAVEE